MSRRFNCQGSQALGQPRWQEFLRQLELTLGTAEMNILKCDIKNGTTSFTLTLAIPAIPVHKCHFVANGGTMLNRNACFHFGPNGLPADARAIAREAMKESQLYGDSVLADQIRGQGLDKLTEVVRNSDKNGTTILSMVARNRCLVLCE
jgi:hypothetical protein